jgi:hypothetical protein
MSESRVTYQLGIEPDGAPEPAGFFVPEKEEVDAEPPDA